jgi:hypothetical protein
MALAAEGLITWPASLMRSLQDVDVPLLVQLVNERSSCYWICSANTKYAKTRTPRRTVYRGQSGSGSLIKNRVN